MIPLSTFFLRMRGACSSALLIAGGALAGAMPAEAQSTPNSTIPRQSWTVEVTPGLLIQPVPGGGSGGALAITFGRAARRGTWSPSLLLAAARVGDVGYHPGDNFFIIDRYWGITAIGVDAFVARTEPLAVSLGAKGGVLWNTDRQGGVRGTPVGQFGSTGWEMKAGLIVDAAARYRVGERVSLASRVGLVQHVFTDDLIGNSGGLASLGVALTW